MKLEEKMKNLREKNNLSIEELSKSLEISEETLNNWEKGIEKPNEEQIKKICEILKIEPEELNEPTKEEEKNQEKASPEEPKEENKFETINDFKPRKWLLIILIIIALVISIILINKAINVYNESKKNHTGIFDTIFGDFIEEKEKFNSDFFNSDYEFHKGTQDESSVKDLLDDVITNNKKNKNHLITIVYETHNTTDSEEITNIKNEITENKKYEVLLDYNEKQYVNKITITGTIDKDSFELKTFNGGFEFYTGTQKGMFVSNLLDNIITNNKKNQEHLLTVVYGTHTTTNPDEITNIKQELDDWHDYEVSLDYGEDGYANKVTIK